ncbi:hypothetical protein C0J08_06160 [Marinomonas sp. CT5]|uniref:hypothetical protein n=1 Tax=Marinomonas sp. CT5 TaxID=2066133 RepID=UPI001BAF90DC|nr:hypothetical protein [Marinomonas sp. CT5]QUX95023.1 hypothetical protein C0J08_06160 [Marinomonas sp. CT5]
MLIISLLVGLQQSVTRFATRRALAKLTPQQMLDIGMTEERRREELSQANLFGWARDLMLLMRNSGRSL